MRKITLPPAAHGPLGNPSQIYVDRFSGHYGIEHPTREQLARLDRKRKKKGSNQEWTSPADPDARIAKMKDGRTHLAHKVEHAVDLASGAPLAITLQRADAGDTPTLGKTVEEAQSAARQIDQAEVQEVVADKGYHSGPALTYFHQQGMRSYIRNRIAAGGTGRGRGKPRNRSGPTRIGDA